MRLERGARVAHLLSQILHLGHRQAGIMRHHHNRRLAKDLVQSGDSGFLSALSTILSLSRGRSPAWLRQPAVARRYACPPERLAARTEGFDQNQRLQELPHLHFVFRSDPSMLASRTHNREPNHRNRKRVFDIKSLQSSKTPRGHRQSRTGRRRSPNGSKSIRAHRSFAASISRRLIKDCVSRRGS